MARLFSGEKDNRSTAVLQVLHLYDLGLSEAEIADMLGWERRTANNYLHDLAQEGKVYKEGRLWFPEE